MPVKVRCRSCKKVINVPDRARGKAIKCPSCEGTVRVPSGDGKQPRQGKAPTKRRKSSAQNVGNAIAGVDLKHAEDRRVQVCPKCGSEVTEDDIDCPACGIDLATGKVSIRTLRKKGLAAADPLEFYGKAWSSSARFVLDNINQVFRTGIYWTILMLLLGGSLGMLGWLVIGHGEKWPLILFFEIMSFLFWAGMLGWYGRLAIEIIRVSQAKKTKISKVNFDFFEALSLGCKVVFWPIIFLLPILVVVAAVTVPILAAQGFTLEKLQDQVQTILGGIADGKLQDQVQLYGGIAAGIIFGLCLLVFPVAMVHMSMPYTYKAWLPTEMFKVWAKNIGPSLYWLMLFVVVNLPMIGFFGGLGLLSKYLEGFFQKTLASWASSILALVGEKATEGTLFSCVHIPLAIFFVILIIAPICILAAFPAVFTMRANGLLAFYRKNRLELIREKSKHEKAGFWVRYLAFLIDALLALLAPFLIKNRNAMTTIWSSIGALPLTFLFAPGAFPYHWPFVIFLCYWCYFVLGEGSPDQGTIGKHAIGIVVLSEKTMKQLMLKQAALRFFTKILSGLLFGIGFLLAAFTFRKQALHDKIVKSVVVFRGDDDASTS